MPQKIAPFLWFDTEAEQAAEHYTSIFPNSRIVSIARYTGAGPGEAGSVMTVELELDGLRVVALNGGPQFTFSEAFSLQIDCETQEEVDHYWTRLTEGGEESQCGWLKDRFGFSWQVVPRGLKELVGDPDRARAKAAMEAMFKMKKIDLAAMRAAADSVPAA
ncbi:MAG TPA: VOC family protein [Solirubrobacteraceae bacterium]|jgi:predicted 3-demethylubiquinone-9 3-methyltransferase (glyoxalase superfamily)|nr:VOC family protein [Solirubrobacteraceae bacterium]